MKKRMLSLLLALCFLVGIMPTTAFAVEPEEALYAQMLELGLVDAEGALIEDNTFTVEDGTRLYSLTELIEWLNQCEESDLDTLITVDRTGRSATVEQLMYALLIENQIADVAGQLNLLASGGYALTNTSAASAIDTTVHDLEVRMVMSYQANKSVYSLRVNLYNKNSNTLVTEHDDVTVEVGLFADFLKVGEENYAADGTVNVPGTNYFKEFTIPAGSSYISFELDLQKLRDNYLSKYEGLWDGNAYLLLQARTVSTFSRMPDSSDTIYIKIAPSSDTDPVVDAITGGTIIGMNDDDKNTVVPYRLSWSGDGTTVKINGSDYFQFDVDIPAAKDSYNSSTFGWKNYFGRAMQAGVGVPGDPQVKLENVTIWTDKSKSSNELQFPKLYVKEITSSDVVGSIDYTQIANNPVTYGSSDFADGTSAADYLASMTKIHLGKWEDDTSNVTDDNLYKKIKKHDWQLARFTGVTVPVYSPNENVVSFPQNWYLNVDWITQSNKNDIQPKEILMHGALTIADSVAPTIESIDVPAYETKAGSANADFYPGNVIPIVVTFSEPVYGDYELVYLDGKDTATLSSYNGDGAVGGDVTRSSNPILSNTRVFYYTVRSTDNTVPTEDNPDVYFKVMGVKPVDDNCADVYGNQFTTNAGSGTDAYKEHSAELLMGCIRGGELKYGLKSMTAAPDTQDPRTINFIVDVDSDLQFQQMCLDWSNSPSLHTAEVVLDGSDQSVYLSPAVADEGSSNQRYVLAGSKTLDDVETATDHVAELYFDSIYSYGICAAFTQYPVVYADENAYTISIDGSWPSGVDNTIFMQDEEAVILSFTDNLNDYTYKYLGTNDVKWVVSDSSVVKLNPYECSGRNMTLTESPQVSIEAKSAGTATIYLLCGNNGTRSSTASNTITVTVKDNGKPTLLFPKNANTIYARIGTDQTVHFTSNLIQHAPSDGNITASLYEGSSVAENAVPIWSETLDRSTTSLTIPGEKLVTISKGDTASYILRLTATANVDNTDLNLSTDAKIIVRAQPALITLTGLDNPLFTDDETIEIGWTVDNFDLENNPDECQFQFTVEKDGNIIYTTDEKSYSGSYTLTPTTPEKLKDYYIVTAKAKNGADPTWSIASSTITVYKTGALDILIGGEKMDSVTLKNEISGGTTTSPAISTYSGENIDGLTNAQAIAKLRSELSLMESISINFKEYDWSILYDAIQWSTSTGRGEEITDEMQRAVSVNYREGNLYSPLENYSYTCYLPQTIMLLCGIRDGSNIITAQHNSMSQISESVTVNVETLKNKLYLFQFTPAVKTEVSYEDGLGVTHTVYTNDDGSLALFEPNGIASDLWAASFSKGDYYRGTITQLALKSGEGNGTRGELYPLNTAELRLAATAQVQLLQPDGTPLKNTNVTLRGGVYRNRYAADNRDDAYCADARFAKAAGQTASLDGTMDQTFTTDSNGMLTVHMDLSQFTSANNPEAVGVGDSLEFIFELRFADSYYPEIITVNGSLNSRDAMRSGEYIVTLTAAQRAKPFVAVQTISYTGREIDVRRHTGVVGPSSNYPSAILNSTIMLWGMDVPFTDTGYHFDLRSQQTGVSVPGQNLTNVKDASYPFSSIPLINDVVTIDSSSFVNYDGTRKTPLEAALYNGNGGLVSTISLPFGIADLTTIEKVEDAPSVMSLMSNIAAYGTVGGANTKYEYANKVSDGIMNDALSFLEKMGGEAGLVKAILMPTADPTRYEAYLWTGINTTKLEDLEYDRNGVSLEPSYIGQDYDSLLGEVNDTFTLSDFIAMSDGSYFDDRSNLYGAVANGVLALPIMLQLEGWVSAEIRYNFDKGQWQVLTTGGGFTAGAQMEFEKALNLTVYGIPLTASFMVRGGAVVDFQTAIRYAEQLGLEWNDDTADKVNDYLTALRISAYFEFFGGVGFDKGFTAKIGLFGKIDINNENRFLTRKYLKNQSDRDMAGQFLQLDGEAGIKAALGVGPLVTEITVVSLGFGTAWSFNEWDDINDYWDAASSGLVNNWLGDETAGQSYSLMSNRSAVIASEPVVKLQSRDYLEEGDRIWLGGDNGIALMSLDEPDENKLKAIETNSYPFSTPMISDDGSILVYLSDADSEDVTDVEVRYSLTDGGYFPDGTAIPDGTDGFSGYGDSSLDFDGTADFAGAIWLREAATVGLKAGTVLNESQQIALLNGLEVVASIWNGKEWVTTRLTDNGSQEFDPVIAVNDNGRAIAVWRSVQTNDDIYNFTQNRILCKIFDGKNWSETYTLYNGNAGEVTGISAEMLSDGTAAVAFSVKDENDISDIYYTVVDTEAENIEDNAKTIRATTNEYIDENPQLIAVDDMFVMGWSSIQSLTGADKHDVGLRVFDKTGAPQPILPESLSDMVSTAAFDGQFTFVKGADSLDELSILWNDANAGSDDNDVIRAIKFVRYDDSYISSAAIEVAELPERTGLNHMDAYITNGDGTSIQAVIQGTEYSVIIADDPNTEEEEPDDPETYKSVKYSYKMDVEEYNEETGAYEMKTKTYSGTGLVPKETVNLLSASATYTDDVEVVSTMVDYTTLATESYVPVNFTVANQGMNIIDSVTINLDGAEPQTFTGLTLLPGQSNTFSVVTLTGEVIKNLDYTVKAEFIGDTTRYAGGTVYLDYPDVGISALTVTKEQDGIRTVLANLYNQSAASLNKSDRRVVLGVYSDPECETPIDGKYFEDGIEDDAYELILNGDTLASIDDTGYTQAINFKIGEYVKDAGLNEIPSGGVTFFVKARIEQKVGGEWIVLPEADNQNNQKYITFDSLLTISENAPTTVSVEIDNGDATTAYVQVRNNSLKARNSGYLVAALLDVDGNLLETKNVGDLELETEGVIEIPVAFSESGARVVLRYGEAASDGSTSNANAAGITIDGLPLTLNSFDKNDSAEVDNVSIGKYLLTVIPEDIGATVTVNGIVAENGMANISGGSYRRTITVVITAADGITTRTYTIYLNPEPSQGFDFDDMIPNPVYNYYTLNFVTNGGTIVPALRRIYGTTIDLTAYTPTRSGYIFTGWYADKAMTEIVTKVKLTGNTTVYAGWRKEAVKSPFIDVPEGSYYEQAVNWAVENGVTTGTTANTFSPDAACTRAQAVTFLWRAAGCPIPESSDMPFNDVVKGSYYETAVLWAVENGITNGTSDTTFSPDAECTRAQIVTFLWRSLKSPAAGTDNPFTDVAADAYYADAVLWAVENGITLGTSDTTFSPNADCTRAQIVTFLWRALAE